VATVNKASTKVASAAKKVTGGATRDATDMPSASSPTGAGKGIASKSVAPSPVKSQAKASAPVAKAGAKTPVAKAAVVKATPAKAAANKPAPAQAVPSKSEAAKPAPKMHMPKTKSISASPRGAAQESNAKAPKAKKTVSGLMSEVELLGMSDDDYMNEAQLAKPASTSRKTKSSPTPTTAPRSRKKTCSSSVCAIASANC
jgi:hypothetical protein